MSQTHAPLEIIVVDDGSADDTGDKVGQFGQRVKLLRQRNRGPAAACNRAIAAAKADWIGLLDADDEWLPSKLERQLPYTLDDGVGVVYCRQGGHQMTLATLWERNRIGTSTVLLRRAAFLAVGQFDEDPPLIGVEDYNLWLRMAAAGWGLQLCPERLINYQSAHNSLTRQIERFANARARKRRQTIREASRHFRS